MNPKDTANLTTIQKIIENYDAIIKRDNLEYLNTHSLFGRGALIGMEAVILAISSSMKEQKLLEDSNESVKKINNKKRKKS